MTISRLSAGEQYKGHDRVIRLLPRLAAEFPDIAYVIGGDGDDRGRLETLATGQGVAHLCRFIGHIPDEEIVEHYRMADVLVMPSTGEGFGIVFLEAMACGTPAIGLDVDGSVDPLERNPIGYAVSETTLHRCIAQLLARTREKKLSNGPRATEIFTVPAFTQHVSALMQTWFT